MRPLRQSVGDGESLGEHPAEVLEQFLALADRQILPPGLGRRWCRQARGRVAAVVRGLRRMGTTRGLAGAKRKRLAAACGYLAKNAPRMRYDQYLAKGYPIASGVIEGACRHYVKDRLERAGGCTGPGTEPKPCWMFGVSF